MTTRNDEIVRMTPVSEDASWWAAFLLELGKNARYDLLIQYLELAQKNGCLHEIRLAAVQLVKEHAAVMKKARGPVKRRSGTIKAVA